MEQTNPNEISKGKRIFLIVYTTIMILYCIAMICLSAISFQTFLDNAESLEQTLSNFQQPFIDRLFILEGGDGCPEGSKELFFYDYPGTTAGCNCTGADSDYPYDRALQRQACNQTQIKFNCNDIQPSPGMRMNKWRRGNLLCANRVRADLNYLATFRNKITENECVAGFKSCGIGAGLICIPSEVACPVSQISFKSDDGFALAASFTDGTSLYTNRNASARPLVEGRIGEAGICLEDNTQNAVSEGTTQYPLETRLRSRCKTDTQFKSYDKWGEKKCFEVNGVAGSVAATNPHYTSYLSDERQWSLFGKDAIEWKFHCKDLIEPLASKTSIVKSMKVVQLILFIITISASIVLGVLLPYMNIMALCGRNVICMVAKSEDQMSRLKRAEKILDLTAKLIKIPFAFWAVILTRANGNYFGDIVGCSDDNSNSLFKNINKLITSSYLSNTIFIGLTILLAFFELMKYLYEKYCKKEPLSLQKVHPDETGRDGQGSDTHQPSAQRGEFKAGEDQMIP
jgi:hypothetical protein